VRPAKWREWPFRPEMLGDEALHQIVLRTCPFIASVDGSDRGR
jgi:hypothetical protein